MRLNRSARRARRVAFWKKKVAKRGCAFVPISLLFDITDFDGKLDGFGFGHINLPPRFVKG